jgi:hypothetical protein
VKLPSKVPSKANQVTTQLALNNQKNGGKFCTFSIHSILITLAIVKQLQGILSLTQLRRSSVYTLIQLCVN